MTAFGAIGLGAFARPGLLIGLCLAVIAGTVVGKRLNGRLDERRFAQLVRGLLVALSLFLLGKGILTLWT